jgi:REP element-mobilizing transposase RayT
VFLVSTATFRRQPTFAVEAIARSAVDTLTELTDRLGLIAWVLMPDHAHLVVQPDEPLADAIRVFKSLSWKAARERAGLAEPLWQRGFHDRGIRGERALRAAIDYVHANPLKARLVDAAEDWPWSSYGRWSVIP